MIFFVHFTNVNMNNSFYVSWYVQKGPVTKRTGNTFQLLKATLPPVNNVGIVNGALYR